MNDDLEQIGIRAPSGTKARIQEHIGYGRPYRDLTDFVIAAIDEKLDPGRKREEFKKDLIELLQDPEVRRALHQ